MFVAFLFFFFGGLPLKMIFILKFVLYDFYCFIDRMFVYIVYFT